MPIIAEKTTVGFMGALILAVHKGILRNRILFLDPEAEDLDDEICKFLRYQFSSMGNMVSDTEQVSFVGFGFAEDDLYWARDRRKKTAWIWYHPREQQGFDHGGIIDINLQLPDVVGFLWHDYMQSGVYTPRMESWFAAYGRMREILDALVEGADLPLLLEAARQHDFSTVLTRLRVGHPELSGLESREEVEETGRVEHPVSEIITVSCEAGDKDAGIDVLIIMDEAKEIHQFVSSATSKIYHRTECGKAKRIQKRELFDSPGAAEGAGKRPCKACKPKG